MVLFVSRIKYYVLICMYFNCYELKAKTGYDSYCMIAPIYPADIHKCCQLSLKVSYPPPPHKLLQIALPSYGIFRQLFLYKT